MNLLANVFFPEQALPQMATTIFMAISLTCIRISMLYHDACTDVDSLKISKICKLGMQRVLIYDIEQEHIGKPVSLRRFQTVYIH
jgi:hypothetical protein